MFPPDQGAHLSRVGIGPAEWQTSAGRDSHVERRARVTMKGISMWEDPAFLRHVIPPEEDRHRIYPSTGMIEPRWFRSPNVFPIERHPGFKYKGRQYDPPELAGYYLSALPVA